MIYEILLDESEIKTIIDALSIKQTLYKELSDGWTSIEYIKGMLDHYLKKGKKEKEE